MNPRRSFPRGVWSLILAVAFATTFAGSALRAENAPERGGGPPHGKGKGLVSKRAAWKSQGAGQKSAQATGGITTTIVGRASMVINGAGTVIYTRNVLGGTCDPNDVRAQGRWTANHVYAAGEVVSPTLGPGTPNGFDGFNFQASGGTSGATEPTWPTSGVGATVVDNTITWTAIGFDPAEFVGCIPMQIVSRASGGAETVIAQESDTLSDGSQLAGWAEFIAGNASGKAAFRAALAGFPFNDRDDEGQSGIFTAGPGAGALTRIAVTGDTIGGRPICGFSAMVGINDAGQVLFDGYSGTFGPNPFSCDENNHSLIRNTVGTNELLVAQGSAVGGSTVVGFGNDDNSSGSACGACEYENIDGKINPSGHVVVVLRLADTTQGVFNFTGPGTSTQVARTGVAGVTAIGPRAASNATDQVVYRATVGGVDHLFRFTPPSTTVTIVSVGDVVNGHTISSIQPFADINASGNVVYGARFAADGSSGFYFWDGTNHEIATGHGLDPDSMSSEMITINDANQVCYITGTVFEPDETDGAAEGHEADNVGEGAFLWTLAGGSSKLIANGDNVGGVVTALYAQHPSFARRQFSSAGCLATAYTVGTDDSEMDCTEGDPSSGCYSNSSPKLFVSCGAVCPTITLSPPTLPGGSQGTPYSQQITAIGGTAPYTFALTAGTLPAGITLSTGGLLSGTPTVAGTFPITITATDSAACTGSQAYSLVIGSPTQVTISITPPTRTIVVGSAASLTVTINIAQGTDTIVTLTSSDPTIASVPPTVTILAGQTSASFQVTGVAVGGPVTITAALPPSFNAVPATASVTVVAAVLTIPTLSGWMLALLAGALAAVGFLLARLR